MAGDKMDGDVLVQRGAGNWSCRLEELMMVLLQPTTRDVGAGPAAACRQSFGRQRRSCYSHRQAFLDAPLECDVNLHGSFFLVLQM